MSSFQILRTVTFVVVVRSLWQRCLKSKWWLEFFFFLAATSYLVSVRTGDVRGAGTDANVFVQIFGAKGDTGKLQLRSAENTKNKFERSRTDQFVLEAVDIGKVGVEKGRNKHAQPLY